MNHVQTETAASQTDVDSVSTVDSVQLSDAESSIHFEYENVKGAFDNDAANLNLESRLEAKQLIENFGALLDRLASLSSNLNRIELSVQPHQPVNLEKLRELLSVSEENIKHEAIRAKNSQLQAEINLLLGLHELTRKEFEQDVIMRMDFVRNLASQRNALKNKVKKLKTKSKETRGRLESLISEVNLSSQRSSI